MSELARPDFGKRIHSQGVVLRGKLSEFRWKALLVECARALGMSPTGMCKVWLYPVEDGKGGTGATIVQPITESFLALDTWPDHDGAYLYIVSCRRFDLTQLVETIRAFGLGQEECTPNSTLRLA